MKKVIISILVIFVFLSLCLSASAHSGGTDSNGGHHDGSDYHYHHGYPAHDHYDMDGDGDLDCPYYFIDKNNATENSSTESFGERIFHNAQHLSFADILGMFFAIFLLFWAGAFISMLFVNYIIGKMLGIQLSSQGEKKAGIVVICVVELIGILWMLYDPSIISVFLG